MRKVLVRTFQPDDEPYFWEWLGDAYLGSVDHSDGYDLVTQLRVQTVDGEKFISPGDVVTQDAEGLFRVFTSEEFEATHEKSEADA